MGQNTLLKSSQSPDVFLESILTLQIHARIPQIKVEMSPKLVWYFDLKNNVDMLKKVRMNSEHKGCVQ